MSPQKSDYEEVLTEYSNRERVVALLGQYRPYLEMLPSMRRPTDSVISIPLPLARIRNFSPVLADNLSKLNINETISIPCDLAILMCDPEWKIKMGVEIMVFIHRPQEDFSDLLKRWRQTQLYLDGQYEWVMPQTEAHMFSDLAEQINPLFILFANTPERIKKGLKGASLPYIEHKPALLTQDPKNSLLGSGPSR
jgi:hypothetical protein